MSDSKPRVALFVTCLVDLYRPTIGFAAIRLLEEAGCQVEVPRAQTCCGQPAYNTGDRGTARDLARGIIDAFGGYDYVVVPSGSCGGMLKNHLPHLFDDDPNLRPRADAMAAKTFELISFLTDVRGLSHLTVQYQGGPVTYHDSCSGLRELGIKDQPRRLLAAIGADVIEMTDPEVCCGFGGTFCVKYPDISIRMVSDKTADIVATGTSIDATTGAGARTMTAAETGPTIQMGPATGVETVLAGDLGCLLNIAGRLKREGHATKARHVAEVLAGMTGQVPPIGEGAA